MPKNTIRASIVFVTLVVLSFAVLWIIGLENYLLFHIITEFFSIVIAFSVFIIIWNGKSYLKNNYLIILGIAYLYIGFLDLLHVIGYTGMNIFDYDYYANQLWIAARGMEALTMFFGLCLMSRQKILGFMPLIIIYTIVSVFLLYSIFFSDIFPVCFIDGVGQTRFKIVSEYVINGVLAATLIHLRLKKSMFSYDSYRLIVFSILFTILSELAFTFYISNYGISNMLGHYAKIVSFYFIYKVLIRKNIIEPYDSIFGELSAQKEELRKADNMKTHLMSIISHDLRGPLSGIKGIAEVLDGEYRELTAEESRGYISDLRNAVDATSALVENLLDWSKIELEGHQLLSDEYELDFILKKAIAPLQFSYDLKNISIDLHTDEGAVIYVDFNNFMIILRNILSNALKFSEKGSTVQIEAGNDAGYAVINVTDHGRGMDFDPAMFQNHVNETMAGTEHEKGSGLGLYMIKKYTDENSGEVAVDSAPGRGTRVTLRFPSCRPDSAE